MVTIIQNGNEHISSGARRLAEIQLYILIKWGVFTIYNYTPYDVSRQVPGVLNWYVPQDVSGVDFIVEWLQEELAQFEEEPSKKFGLNFPGTRVYILLFSGTGMHLEKGDINKIVEQAMAHWQKIIEQNKQKSDSQ